MNRACAFCCKYIFRCYSIYPPTPLRGKIGVICFHPRQKYYSITVSQALVHVLLDVLELVADKHSQTALTGIGFINDGHLKCCYISQHCYSDRGF